MKKLLLSLLLIFSTTASANEPTDNPDEYRDCVVYTIEEAIENSVPENNILIFTYSDKTTRAFHTNVDCATPALVDETPSSPQEGNSGGSSSSSGSSGSSNSGNSGGSSSGNNSGDYCDVGGNDGVHGGGCN